MIEYIEDFDYGGTVAEKEVAFKLWPTTGNKVCLVDADLLPYRVGYTLDPIKVTQAEMLVREGHCKDIKSTPQFESAFESLCMTLNKWIRDTGCDSALLYSTKSSSNFRLDIAFTDPYKGQRPSGKPPFFQELKDAMTERLGCELADGIEADDKLSIEAWRRIFSEGFVAGSPMHKEMCDCVIASSDKDSTITPVWHYNPDTGKLQWITQLGSLLPKYNKKMVNHYEYQGTGEYWKRGDKAGQEKTKRVLIGKKPSSALTDLKGTGLKFFYAQIVMGDASDNYKGLPNVGMTGAFNLLDNCKSEKELYFKVLGAYKEVYGSGKHWCPHYKGTQSYYDLCMDLTGEPPEDWEIWKGRGAYLTAYERMLEQGRLAWMQTFEGDIWRKDKSPIIDPHDLEFWQCRN